MREMPASLETALEEAGKLESIEAAQKRLQRVKMNTGALPVAAAIGESETLIPQANALKRGSEIPLDPRVDELTKEVKRLDTRVGSVEGRKRRTKTPKIRPLVQPQHCVLELQWERAHTAILFYGLMEQVNRRPSN